MTLRRYFAAIWLSLCFAPMLLAQSTASSSEDSSKSPAMSYAIAVMATMLVLVILCMPSRKR